MPECHVRAIVVGRSFRNANQPTLIGRNIDREQRRDIDDAEGVLHRARHRRDHGTRLDAFDRGSVLGHLRFPLLDGVPSHESWSRPIGRNGFNDPAAGMFGGKGDALGLAGLDRERVEPERLPAVVKAVEQAEMVAMQAKDGCDLGTVGECQHDDASGFGAEGRL